MLSERENEELFLASLMENTIQRLGLEDAYVAALVAASDGDATHITTEARADGAREVWHMRRYALWHLIRATPEQRVTAALDAIEARLHATALSRKEQPDAE